MIQGVTRVVGGLGGDALVFVGSEKTAVMDSGMAYCAPLMVEKVNKVLEGRSLDYMLTSHTHYDHIGGLPYLRQKWPNLICIGNAHGESVLKRQGALQAIRRLSEAAAQKYQEERYQPLQYQDEDLRIDEIVKDGDVISLGDRHLRVLETPGHTNCSLSYYLEEEGLMLPCESVGCYVGKRQMVVPFLTSYEDTITSIQRCRNLHPRAVVSPHYGLVERITPQRYFDLALEAAKDMKDYILKLRKERFTEVQMIQACQNRYWTGETAKEQPLMAFLINAKAAIAVICREFGEKE